MYFFFLIDLLIKIISYTYFFTGCYENKQLKIIISGIVPHSITVIINIARISQIIIKIK